jgi:hypothetical protein
MVVAIRLRMFSVCLKLETMFTAYNLTKISLYPISPQQKSPKTALPKTKQPKAMTKVTPLG